MRKPDHHEPQSVDMLRQLGYESSDVSLPTLVKWIAFLFIFIGGTSILTWIIYVVFVPTSEPSQQAAAVARLPKEAPQIQSRPKIDMKDFRAKEEAHFSGYGWVDKTKGIAYVSVDDKLDEIAASGTLPKAAPGGGLVAPARGADQSAPAATTLSESPTQGADRSAVTAPGGSTPGAGTATAPASGTAVNPGAGAR